MQGMELSKAYYETFGRKMIQEKFPEYEDRIAVGLVGEGSECFGYDDEISKDHDYGPEFCMWMKRSDYEQIGEALQAEYEQKLTEAQTTGDRIVKEAVARGQNREEEILRKANEEAAAILNKASADIALEKKKALNDAKDEISDLAMAIAGKVVGRELTADDQGDLIDRFIDQLGDEV